MASQAQDAIAQATHSDDSVILHEHERNGDYDEHDEHDNGITPLPKLQMLIIFLIQISEPTTATVIYPFVNHLVRFTGVTGGDDRKTGYYAGLIVRDPAFLFSICANAHPGIGLLFCRKLHSHLLGPSRRLLRSSTSPTFWTPRSRSGHGHVRNFDYVLAACRLAMPSGCL